MTGFHYVLKPLPPGDPWWFKKLLQTAIEVANEAHEMSHNLFGLPWFIWVDPSFAELRPLAITDGTER